METRRINSREQRWWDLPAAFLLLVVLTAGFTRLVATQWTEGLTITRTLTYLGLIAGLALGYSIFSPRVVAFFAIAYGAFAIPWRLGMTMDEGIVWTERLTSLFGRLTVIITQLIRQQPVTDNLFFLTLMSALFWGLSIHAGYSLTRYASPWRTVLPVGLAMVVIHSYDAYIARRSWYLFLYLFFALLLVARLVYLHQRRHWEQTRTYTPPHIGLDFIRVALAATVVLLLLSWTVPALAESFPAAETAWERIKQPWDDVRDNFDNAFASLRSSVGFVNDYYGSSHSLGRGSRLSDNIVFNVLTPPEPPDGVRFYWRARVFDNYNDGDWQSSLVTTQSVSPQDFGLSFPTEPNRNPGLSSFSFTPTSPIATLITAPQPRWVSRPARAELLTNPDGTVDLGSLRADPTIQAGETYHVRASLSGVTVAQMRESSFEYPEWVKERYLQLPDTITPRTRQLAVAITEGADNPYDKVAAITSYLRNNIEYNETVPELPRNQELIDWFLFDLRQGFCDYYATAEVILLRSIGIPARLAVGYAQGETQEVTSEYIVRQRDAHSWPEVYFAGLGWIEFEPTAGQPDLSRPLGERPNSEAGQPVPTPPINLPLNPDQNPLENDFQANAGSRNLGANIFRIVLGTGIALILVLLLVPMKWKTRVMERFPPIPVILETSFRRAGLQPPSILRRWAHRASLTPLARSYLEINSALGRLGRHSLPGDTPAERAVALYRELPLAQTPAQRLVAEYESATYGQNSADIEAARQAGLTIRSLSFRALFQRLLQGRPNSTEDQTRQHRK